jgi:hypothetical protein
MVSPFSFLLSLPSNKSALHQNLNNHGIGFLLLSITTSKLLKTSSKLD